MWLQIRRTHWHSVVWKKTIAWLLEDPAITHQIPDSPLKRSFKDTYSCFSRNCICHDNEAPTAISWPWSPLALDNGLKLDQSDHLPLKFGLRSQMRELGVISNQSKKKKWQHWRPSQPTAEALRANIILTHREVQWSALVCVPWDIPIHHLHPVNSPLFCCFLVFWLWLALGYFNFTQNNLKEWKALLLKMLQSGAMKQQGTELLLQETAMSISSQLHVSDFLWVAWVSHGGIIYTTRIDKCYSSGTWGSLPSPQESCCLKTSNSTSLMVILVVNFPGPQFAHL